MCTFFPGGTLDKLDQLFLNWRICLAINRVLPVTTKSNILKVTCSSRVEIMGFYDKIFEGIFYIIHNRGYLFISGTYLSKAYCPFFSDDVLCITYTGLQHAA